MINTKVIVPYKIMTNPLLHDLWVNVIYNLGLYTDKIKTEIYAYKSKTDDDETQNYGYDKEVIKETIDILNNSEYRIIFFILCQYNNLKKKFLYTETDVAWAICRCNKKIIIMNSDYFDVQLPTIGKKMIVNNKNIYIMTSEPYINNCKMINLPKDRYLLVSHCCNQIMLDTKFNENPINKIYMPGNIDEHYYPERCYFKTNICLKYQNITVYDEKNLGSFPKQLPDNFNERLNKYIGCFCSSVGKEKIILNKHLEVCCVGSLLLAYSSEKDILEEYGFFDGIHCILCDETNYLEKITYVLDLQNREHVNMMRKKGYELVREKYKHSDIAKKIIGYIESVTHELRKA